MPTPCVASCVHTHTRTHRACTLLQAAEDFRNFRAARRATRRVVSKLPLSGRAAPRRAPLAAMMAMRGQGWTLAKPKAKPAEAGAEAGAETEAEVEAEGEAAEEAEAEAEAEEAAMAPGRGGETPFDAAE